MARVLAIDPGNVTGFAVFEGGTLTRCGVVDMKKVTVSQQPGFEVDEIVIEIPQVYPRQKGDPNDLIMVAYQAGVVVGAVGCAKITMVRPHAWKGTVPKEIHNDRVLGALRKVEREAALAVRVPASKRHNMIDAIGLGLWHLRRRLDNVQID